MRTLGLIGGMSWESTLPYYRIINEAVRDRLGGLHSAKLLLHSLDFAEIAELQKRGDWPQAAQRLAAAACGLRDAGAEAILICTNTMHLVAPQVEAAAGIPLLHIADATATQVHRAGLTRVGLLGTRFTMEQAFYRDRIAGHGIEVIVPDDAQRARIHEVIFDELCQGQVRDASRDDYCGIMSDLARRGAQGIVLGCTELGMLVGCGDTALPVFDTCRIHAEYAAEWALAG